MKMKTRFACTECGHMEFKWFGRCPECDSWSTAEEELVQTGAGSSSVKSKSLTSEVATPLPEIQLNVEQRLNSGYTEVNRVLGGGLVPGSAVLIGGEPGMGKSTLLLQICSKLADAYGKVLYVTGEESKRQTKLRAMRLGLNNAEVHVLAETDVGQIIQQAENQRPFVVVMDSIQSISMSEMSSAPGTVSQVRECSNLLVRLAKKTETPIFLVGHVTKEGALAGPRLLEHMVDTVLYMEGDRHHTYRLLRAVKNRFGSTDEIGLFEMRSDGLSEVRNASRAFLQEGRGQDSGSVVTCTIEGTRPLLLEMQALCSDPVSGGAARRTTSGVDGNRVAMLLAVLEKRASLPLTRQDVYLNVVGGVKVSEPAVDLAVALAIASSLLDKSISSRTFVFGEVGLAGEVRTVNQAERRLLEGRNLGFRRCILPESNARDLIEVAEGKVELCPVRTIAEAVQQAGLL